MTEVTSIEFKVITDRAKRNTDELRKSFANVDKQAKQTQRQMKDFTDNTKGRVLGLKSAVTGLASAFGVFQVGKFLTGTIREFEKLKGVLKTVTGGTKQANDAFKLIQDFTATTPFQLSEVTQAFINFKNAGLQPNTEFLKDFGNIAAATGKSITEISEAAFAATTGEFDRLKSIGIKVKNEGETLRVAFQGSEKVIANTSSAIINHLREIGRTNFASALEEQSKTLNGVISNISDQFTFLAAEIGEGGVRTALTDVAREFLKVSKVGSETAKNIGEVLGTAIRTTGSAFIFVLEHIKAFGVALSALAIGKTIQVLVSMAGSLGILTKAFKLLNLTMLANPFVLVATAIVAITSAFVAWTKEIAAANGVNASFFEILTAIVEVLIKNLQPAIETTAKAWNNLKRTLEIVGGFYKSFINNLIASTLVIGDTVAIVTSRFVDLFTNAFDKVSNLASAFGVGLSNILSGNFSGAFDEFQKEFQSGFVTGLDGTFDEIQQKVNERFGTDFVGGVGKAITKIAEDTVTEVDKMISKAGEGATTEIIEHLRESANAAALHARETALAASSIGQASTATGTLTTQTQAAAAAAAALVEKQNEHVVKLKEQQSTLEFQLSTIGKTIAEIDILTAAREEEAGVTSAQSVAIQNNIVALRAEIREKQFGANFKAYIQSLRDERNALKGSRKEREVNVAILRQENAAKAAGTSLTKEQINEIRKEVTLLQQAREAAEERDRAEVASKKRVIDAEKQHQDEIFRTSNIYTNSSNNILRANNSIVSSLTSLISKLLGINTNTSQGSVLGNVLNRTIGNIFGSSFSSSNVQQSTSFNTNSFTPFTTATNVTPQPNITINASGDATNQMLEDISTAVVAGMREAEIERLRNV